MSRWRRKDSKNQALRDESDLCIQLVKVKLSICLVDGFDRADLNKKIPRIANNLNARRQC